MKILDHQKTSANQNIRFIHNPIFVSLQRIYYSSISQRKKLQMYRVISEKDDKVTPQVACFNSSELYLIIFK